MENPDHAYWMRKALELAKKAWGDTHPNPMVGSILVVDGKMRSQGFHERAGCLHAERAALTPVELSKSEQERSTLYVTLEPCCTHGRTPPCTEIILSKGIRNVVIGAIDPNPQHQGKGIRILREAGVNVVEGVLERECNDLNFMFNHRMRTNAPLIALKSAVTLDGRTATKDGHSKWITGESARLDVMKWRRYFPAIAVGAGTALSDNPSLTIREAGKAERCSTRIIFDHSLRTREVVDSLKVFNDTWAKHTVIVTANRHSDSLLRPYLDRGCGFCKLDYSTDRFPIEAFREWCLEKQLWGVFVEGGQSLNASLLGVHGVDYWFIYQAPKVFMNNQAPGLANTEIVSYPEEAPYLEDPIHEVLGNDILTRGGLIYPKPRLVD